MNNRVPSIVWVLIAGDGFSAAFRFMVMPFLALYMHTVTGASPAMVGLVIGLAALSSLVASFVLGPLSDRLGRKPSLVAGSLAQLVGLVGFGFAHTLPAFAALQVFSGMAWALQGPAYQALLTDLTPEPRRVRIFGLNYWAVNIGAATGPLLGAVIGSGRSPLPFLIAAAAQALMIGAIVALLPRHSGEVPSGASALDSLRHMGQGLANPVLLWSFVGLFLTGLTYSQIESTLPQFLGLHYANGAHLFAYVLTANAVSVVVFQPFLSRWQEDRPLILGFVGGALIYAISNAAFIFAVAPAAWIGTNVVFTIGEVLLAPVQQAIVAQYAPKDRRATFFTLQNIVMGLAFAIGPFAGGVALGSGGKAGLFGAMAFIDLMAAAVFAMSLNQRAQARAASGI
ncbi:MAG: MFS transporter [Thermaerobacter sp.]|nr:MFS transporter [Thermaerobacter sp.]